MFDTFESWTFAGLSLPRLVDGDTWATWFTEDTIMAIDAILGSDERITDVGGVTYQPLSIRAAFETPAARDALRAKRGQTHTLASIEGNSRRATLKTFAPIATKHGLYYADLTFEAA